MTQILTRCGISLAVAAGITAGLILLMQHLIQTDEPGWQASDPLTRTDIFARIEDLPPDVTKRPLEPPIKPEPPPFAPTKLALDLESGGGLEFEFAVDEHQVVIDQGGAEGDALPIVRVPPEYPNRMATKGIEGWVLVEFMIDKLGRVRNPQVVDAQPRSGFNAAALKAVERYKYKPRVVNGDPVPVHGVRQRIVFNLDT